MNDLTGFVNRIATTAWDKMNCSSLTQGKDLGKLPPIRYKVLKGVHGLAYPDHIELNHLDIDRLMNDESELQAFLRRVTIHELAHVAEYRVTKVMSHGPGWHAFDTAGGGVGLQIGYVLHEHDWEIDKKEVGPAWAVLQLLSFAAITFIILYIVFHVFGCKEKWLGLPLGVVGFFATVIPDAVLVKKAKDLEMCCCIKFFAVASLAIYLLFQLGVIY